MLGEGKTAMTAITIMAASLLFSSRGLAFNVATFLRSGVPGRCLLVPYSFHCFGAKLVTVIDCMPLLVNRSAFDSCFTTDCIPLATTCIFKDLIVTPRCGILGRIIETGTGAVLVSDFKVSILSMGSIHLIDLFTISRHKMLEGCLVVAFSCIPGFKLGNISMLLHSIPVDTVGGLHNSVRSIGFLEIGAVVP